MNRALVAVAHEHAASYWPHEDRATVQVLKLERRQRVQDDDCAVHLWGYSRSTDAN